MRRKPEPVVFSNKTLVSAQYLLRELDTSTRTKKSNKPQFEFQNLKVTDKRIFGISMTPDRTFSEEGIIEILVNEVRLLPNQQSQQGAFSSITALNIPIPPNYGLRLDPDKKLEVFVWNPSGNSAKINFACFLGDIK